MNRHRLGLCSALLAAACAAALPPPAAAQEAGEEAPRIFTDRVDVRVIEVEVVATDRDGNPVTGLGRDDFELFEDGEPVTLTNFYAVEGGRATAADGDEAQAPPGADGSTPAATPAPDHRLNLIVFIDNLNTPPLQRNRVLTLVREQLSRLVRPGDPVMVVSYDRALRIEQRFCQDLDLVFAALDRMEANLGGAASLGTDKRRILGNIVGASDRPAPPSALESDADQVAYRETARNALQAIHTYAQETAIRTEQMLGALASFADSLAGLPGRKAVLLVSGGIDLRPGEDLFDLWMDRFQFQLGSEIGVSSAIGEAQRYDQNANFERVLDALRASQVVLYGLGIDASVQSALRTADLGGGGVAAVTTVRGRDSLESLRTLAGESGGVALPALLKSAPVFDRMAADFASYYSLAYARPTPEPGSEHKIEVRVTRPGVLLRYRPAYRAKTLENLAEDGAMTALFHDVTTNPMGIRLELGTPEKQKKDHYLVPVTVRIPIANLLLFPDHDTHRALLTLVVAVQDGEGRLARPHHVQIPISIPNARLLTAMTEEFIYEAKLEMRSGEQKLAVAVADVLARTTSTVNLSVPVAGG